jgi:hypothetical protein
MADQKVYLKWNEVNETWSGNLYQWYDVAIIIKVEQALGGAPFEHTYLAPQEIIKKKLTKDEYKHFIKLVCRVNGIDINQILERNEEGKPEITIKEIRRTINEIAPISVRIKSISRVDI